MAERKPLFMDAGAGFHEEMAQADTATFGGLTLGGDVTMAGNKITGLGPATNPGDAASYGQAGVMFSGLSSMGNVDMNNFLINQLAPGVAGTDAVNKNQLDTAITGISWVEPVDLFNLVGNLGEAALEGLSPTAGDAYVVSAVDGDGTLNPGGVGSLAVGDIVEFDGTDWVRIISGSGGFVPDGTRVILDGTDASTLIAPYAEGVQNDLIMEFDGTSVSGVSTGQTADGIAVLVQDPGHVSYFDNLGYVYEGTPPGGSWIQFTGAGQVIAGDGLYKDGQSIHVGAGLGIDVNADDVQVQLDATEPGLQFTATSGVQVKAADGIVVDSNGVNVDLAASNPGLEFSGGDLRVQVSASGGLERVYSGVQLKIDDTPNTLDMDTDGLKVVGLPLNFEVNDVAVGSDVTAANLDSLTDGSDISGTLHSHDSDYSASGHTHSHASTTGQTADDHHAELHSVASHNDTTATGAELDQLTDGSDAAGLHVHGQADITMPHSGLTGITTDDHHAQVHDLTSGDHTESGLTIGHVLTATGATTFAWSQAPSASEAEKIEITAVVNEAIAVGDPVYWSTTDDRVAKADAAVNAKAYVFGVARTAQATPGQTCEVVAQGEAAGVLTGLGAVAGDNIYLASGGGLALSPPAGSRVIRVGIAMNADDLWVEIIDYGKKAA
jgi:hypothetical protein